MYYALDVPMWAAVLDESDYPHNFELSFGGFIGVAVSIVFPWRFTQALMTLLADTLLNGDD